MSRLYLYGWKNNPKRKELFARCCRILKTGKKNTVLIEMTDTGEQVATSRLALVRVPPSVYKVNK